jgi:hypothetical protein
MHGMKIGPPVLRVKNIDRLLDFYEKGLRLQVNKRYTDDDGNLFCELGFKHNSLSSDKPLLYRIKKKELVEAYNRFVRRIEAKDMSPDRKEKLISPGRDIIALVSEAEDNAKRARN